MEISTFQIISIVLGSSVVGAIVASVGTYFSTTKINRQEREFSFKKEEFLRLQEKASMVFGYIYDNKRILGTMQNQLLNGVYSIEMVQLQRDEKELHKIKQELYEAMNIYFSELRQTHDEYAKPLQGCMSVYFDTIKAGQLSKELISKLKKSMKELETKEKVFIDAFIGYLDQKRTNILQEK